jgi:threonine dehydrogenase-like Zn-dependent dehydrogenase
VAKRLVFSDPYACAIFQHERMCDIGEAQNFRVIAAREKCSKEQARKLAVEETFERTVIYGLGTTGLFIGDQIRRNHPDAKILFVARSSADSVKVRFVKEKLRSDYLSVSGQSDAEIADNIRAYFGTTATVFVGTSGNEAEHRIAFEQGVLGCNGIYDSFSLGPKVSFDTMPFGFKNQVIFASINFTQKHMEEAIKILCKSSFDELVELIDRDDFTKDPMDAYINRIYCKGAPLKTAVVWNKEYIDEEK